MLAALSDAAITGLYGLAGILLTTAGIVAVALIGRDAKRHNQAARRTVDDFEASYYQQRGRIDQLEHDLTWTSQRLLTIEQRERDCWERLDRLETKHSGRRGGAG